jgi:myo-inositol-1(or 4)-monophosphatase
MSEFLLNENNFAINSMEIKSDFSPVSSVDLAIQNKVKLLLKKYLPEGLLISEEEPIPPQWNSESVVVVLDPVDGTENFVSGIPIWATGLAFFKDQKIAASAIFFPEIKMLAKTRNVNFSNESKFVPFKTSFAESRIKAFSSNSDWQRQLKDFGEENRIFGSSLFNLTLAANGALDFKSSLKGVRFWDIAPAVAIALERNMEVVVNGNAYNGQLLDPNSRFVTTIKSR